MDKRLEETEDALLGMVEQHCQGGSLEDVNEGLLDSMALSASAKAMRVLAKAGRIEIVSEYGRRVIGKWIKQPT